MSTENKTLSIEVPADRVAEFYAWYARFLAAAERRERRGRHGAARRCGHGHGRGEAAKARGEDPQPAHA